MALGTAVGLREYAVSSLRMYFEMAAERIGLHPEMRHLLSVPFRELTVELPLRRDDGRLQLFRGYRVQHNGVRGPVLVARVRAHPAGERPRRLLEAAVQALTFPTDAAPAADDGVPGR